MSSPNFHRMCVYSLHHISDVTASYGTPFDFIGFFWKFLCSTLDGCIMYLHQICTNFCGKSMNTISICHPAE